MPVSHKKANKLRVPQVRLLQALMPEDRYIDSYYWIEWPILTRASLGVATGCTPTSGTITRVLNGVREGSSSGEPHLGLLALRLVKEVILDIMGTKETNYSITAAGIRAYQQYGRVLPPVRRAERHTNKRYKEKLPTN